MGLFALLLGNGEGFASLPQSSAPNAGFGARAARFAGPLPRCQACHFCPCSPQEGFGDSPPPMASSCLGWGQLRTAVLSPLGALLRGERWLKALGIQQSGRKWEKMGAEGGGQAPAGLSPSPLQEADAPDQWENLRKGPKPLWGGERGGLSSPLPSPSTDKPSPEPQIGAGLNHCFRNEQVPLGFTFPLGDR